MSNAAALVAQLAAAGTPPDLLAAVAEQLFTAEVELAALNELRASDRQRRSAYCERLGLSERQWRKRRLEVFKRDGFTCQYCSATKVPLSCDHVIPLIQGGSNDLDNLKTACIPCNSAKGGRTPEEWQA